MQPTDKQPGNLAELAAKFMTATDASAGIVAAGIGFTVEQALDTVIALGSWDVASGAGIVAAGLSMGVRALLRSRKRRANERQFVERTRQFAEVLAKHNERRAATALQRLADAYEFGGMNYEECVTLVNDVVRKYVVQ